MKLFDSKLCFNCKGRGFCGKPCKIYSKIKDYTPKIKKHFSGSSPPEIFVGRYNYPNINAGILSPEIHGETGDLSLPENWHKKNLSVDQILTNRSQLIYGRFKTIVKKPTGKFITLMQEIGLTHKPISTEFFLKKIPKKNLNLNKDMPLIGNPAPLESARLEENLKVLKKVDYLTSDTDAKSVSAMKELYSAKISTSHIIKILSAGLLGKKINRKLVPTRWAVTATDDTLSKELLKKIRYYNEINEIQLFHGDYLGNHYEFLLLPDKFAFEAIEIALPGSVWNSISTNLSAAKDHELFNGRKKYAFSVTGAYYTARLAVCEYLEKVKKQAYCLVFREEGPEYSAPLGVGILRELSRMAFSKSPEKPGTIKEAIDLMQSRFRIPIENFTKKSSLLKEYGKQTRLNKWFS
jgi:hypothetical protein